MSIGRGTNNIFDVRTLLKKDLVKRGLRFGLVSLGYCNITLPRGGMCWKIRPLYFYVFVYHNFITLPLYKKKMDLAALQNRYGPDLFGIGLARDWLRGL